MYARKIVAVIGPFDSSTFGIIRTLAQSEPPVAAKLG
jgi:hypothetical protein